MFPLVEIDSILITAPSTRIIRRIFVTGAAIAPRFF